MPHFINVQIDSAMFHALKVQKERTGAPYAETVRRAIMAFLQAQTAMADPSDASRDRSPA